MYEYVPEKKIGLIQFGNEVLPKGNLVRTRCIYEQRLEALSRLNDGVYYVKAWKIDVLIFSQSGNTDRWLTKITNQTET